MQNFRNAEFLNTKYSTTVVLTSEFPKQERDFILNSTECRFSYAKLDRRLKSNWMKGRAGCRGGGGVEQGVAPAPFLLEKKSRYHKELFLKKKANRKMINLLLLIRRHVLRNDQGFGGKSRAHAEVVEPRKVKHGAFLQCMTLLPEYPLTHGT
jgi:hypothetical protein